jgi:molecular chaperone Hsp33
MVEQDRLRRFVFESAPMRGNWVRLGQSWREAREHQQLSPAVISLLGEAFAATSLLAGSLKFKGALTLQLSGGTGLISLLIVQCMHDLSLRGVAHMAESEALLGTTTPTFAELVGGGQLIVTAEQGDSAPPWQGIVALEGDCLARCLERYFAISEQLPTRMVLAANADHAAGMLVQQLPTRASDEASMQVPSHASWDEASAFIATVKSEELLALEPAQLLVRLFASEDLRLFDGEKVRFACRCSRDRVASMLQSLGQSEIEAIIAELGAVTVTCEFCRRPYRYDAVDVSQLFHAGPLLPVKDSLN